MPRSATGWPALLHVLETRAESQSSTIAYTFLRDGADPADTITYEQLMARSRAAAAAFEAVSHPGDRVLLLYPPGLDFLSAFLGAQYAGLIAVPGYLPRPQQIDARIESMARDARPRIAATTAEHADRLRAQIESGAEALRGMSVVDAGSRADAAQWRPSRAGATDIAHLQYTSGSTATPKGVMVSHANLEHNLADMDAGWRHDDSSTIVSWLPAFHDMGLVYGLLAPLHLGVPGVLMPPVVFIQRPVRWLQAISRYRGTHSAAPNFAYELCTRKVRDEDRAALDLSCWHVAVNGAEPVHAASLRRFAEAFAPAGFRASAFAPGYGLAEATLKVTAADRGSGPTITTFSADALEQGRVARAEADDDARPLVACGAPRDETTIAIADPVERMRVASDRIGEIWVSSPSVARGYWNRDDNAETFAAVLADEPGQSFLRTGDLGFVWSGQLFVTGRLKDLIIIRGQNYYPSDIELTVEVSHTLFRPGSTAAFGIDRDDEERLVVVQEVERQFRSADRRQAIEAVRQAVALAHEIHVFDVVLLKPGAIPKTSSGKIQRQACRAGYLDGTLRGRIDDSHE